MESRQIGGTRMRSPQSGWSMANENYSNPRFDLGALLREKPD